MALTVTDSSVAPPAALAVADGTSARRLAEDVLTEAGFTITGRRQRIPKTGVTIDVEAHDAAGQRWLFDVAGPFASHRGGLLRTEAVWRALGRASAIRGRLGPDVPIVLLASHLPRRPSDSDTILRAAGPEAFFDAIDLLSTDARARRGLRDRRPLLRAAARLLDRRGSGPPPTLMRARVSD